MRSTGDQETDCRTWYDQQEWTVGKVITDANRSASKWRTREREGFQEALTLIALKEYDAFVTLEPSRAGRAMLAYVQLRAACQEAGVLYLTKGRVYDFSRHDDSFMMGLEFLTAEKDAAIIRDRQRRTVRLNAKKGRPHDRLPYGYRRVYDEFTGVLIRQEVHPEHSAVIVSATEDILKGVPIHAITTRLNLAGVPTPMKPYSEHSRGWMNMTLRQVLRNPTIAGLRVYRGEVIGEADWPAILAREKWERVNRALEDRSRRHQHFDSGNPSHPKWLLSHIVKCAFCLRPMVRIPSGAPRADGSRRNNYTCAYPGCRKVSVSIDPTDAYVVGALLGWLTKPESLAVIGEPGNDWMATVRQVEEQMAALRKRLDEAAEEYSAGNITLAMLASIEQRVNPQIEELARGATPPVSDEGVLALIQAEDVEEAWERLDLIEQGRLIKMLLEVRVGKATQMGGKFDSTRIKVSPRYAPEPSYQWQTHDANETLQVDNP